MFIAKVAGTVVASQKGENIQGLPLRIVRKINTDAEASDMFVTAFDVIGADDGEYVLVALGSAARQTQITDGRPCDAVIMAIVDTWQVAGEEKYRKG